MYCQNDEVNKRKNSDNEVFRFIFVIFSVVLS